jgi:hypothetical protein
MLRRELEANEHAKTPRNSPIALLICQTGSATRIVEEFRRQVLAYACHE